MNVENNTVAGGLVQKQITLLRRLAAVENIVRGLVAMMWLPGFRRRFGGLRAVKSTRPVAVTLEVTPAGGVMLAGAIARPDRRTGKMVFDTIFRYNFSSPMTASGGGEVLSWKKEIIARRGLDLLAAVVRFGEQAADRRRREPQVDELALPRLLISFNPGEEQIDEAKLTELAATAEICPELFESYREHLRQEMRQYDRTAGLVYVDSAIVDDDAVTRGVECAVEDYSPVLGLPTNNPARGLFEFRNPASSVLAEAHVADVSTIDQETLDRVVAAFRLASPLGERLADDAVFDALCNPSQPARCAAGVDGIPATRVVAAMRHLGGRWIAHEATSEDLLTAAKRPGEPLVLSQLSQVRVIPVEAFGELPAPYAGWLLPRPDWQPRSGVRAATAAEAELA